MLTEAYEQGREAALDYFETPKEERRTRQRLCPYPRGTRKAKEFSQGWEDAAVEINA